MLVVLGARLVSSAFVVFLSGLAVSVAAAQTDTRRSGPAGNAPERIIRIAAATTGIITGVVLDERGQPLDGVVVSATGSSSSFAVTDRVGQYTLRALMPGPYLVRAHLEGYLPGRNTMVNVRPSSRTVSTFTLRRAGHRDAPRVMTAGGSGTEVTAAPAGAEDRDDGEVAWRLRHLKRSILRDSATRVGLPESNTDFFLTDSLQLLGRAVESSARMAGALLTDPSLQGQINLLTTGSFESPGQLLQLERTRGVTFFSVGAPVGGHGDWNVRAALNQGDLSSWILAGNYVTRNPARHRYQFGMSYGVHRYEGGNPAALAAMAESARNVGAVYAYDEWTLSDYVTVGYGGHYAHYDYLAQPAHLSPRFSATIHHPSDRTSVRAVVARRVTAPGAEEFLPPSNAQILPPQRTFAPLTRAGFLPEDMRHYEVSLEQMFDGGTLSVRAFHQAIDNQLVTVFGLETFNSAPAELGHYFVGSAGSVDVRGLGVSLTHALVKNVRGTVDYALADADWATLPSTDRARLQRRVPSALRPEEELIHDLTTSLATEFPQSATRIFMLYKLNTAYTRPDQSSPGFEGRWDVQVTQGLPFMRFGSAEWEMLVGVRNLFRESFTETSVYDELLVASPPKRLVGGITVKF